jgi:glutathione S-transferase
MMAVMAPRLFIVHGSHPCVTVELALRRKGIDHRTIELLPPFHAAVTRVLFGQRTVPAMTFGRGDKVSGSRAILRRLDELQPDPPLLPADPQARERVLAAEAWGDETFQPVARTILWPALKARPDAILGFQQGSRLPGLPAPVVKLLAPGITTAEQKLNATDLATAEQAIRELPAMLDHIDQLLADGVIGADEPNAADLQIAPTVRLLLTVGDVRPLIEGRPLAAWARRVAPEPAGAVPPGVYTVTA